MAANQAPPSLGFSRQEHWSGLPFPPSTHNIKLCNFHSSPRFLQAGHYLLTKQFFFFSAHLSFLVLAHNFVLYPTSPWSGLPFPPSIHNIKLCNFHSSPCFLQAGHYLLTKQFFFFSPSFLSGFSSQLCPLPHVSLPTDPDAPV